MGNKVVLVTGAGSGLGRSISRQLALAGHTVCAGVRGGGPRARQYLADVSAFAHEHGVALLPVELDVLSDESCRGAVDQVVATHGGLDVVVNNAGMLMSGVGEAFTPEQFRAVLDTNAVSWLRMARAALPVMRSRGAGTLVYVSSTTVHVVEPFLAVYTASKAAGEALAEVVGLEVAHLGVDTLIVTPGAFTAGTNHFRDSTPPADSAVASEYPRARQLMDALPARIDAVDLARQGRAADTADVGAALVQALDRAPGAGLTRLVVDPQHKGVEEIIAVRDARRRAFLLELGLDEFVAPDPGPMNRRTAVHAPIEDVVGTFYRAFSGRPDLLAGVVTSDWEDIPLGPDQAPGPEGVVPVIDGISRAFADFSITVHDLVDGRGEDGNGKIAVRAEMRGRHIGEMFGVQATGRTISVPIHEFHDVRDGRLARTWHLEDWFGFLRQTGAVVVGGGQS